MRRASGQPAGVPGGSSYGFPVPRGVIFPHRRKPVTPTAALSVTLKPASGPGERPGCLWATGHGGEVREEQTGGVQRGEVWPRIWVLGQGCCGHLVDMRWSVRRPSGCKDRGPHSDGCRGKAPFLATWVSTQSCLSAPGRGTWHPKSTCERGRERCVEAMTWPQKSHHHFCGAGWSYIPSVNPDRGPHKGVSNPMPPWKLRPQAQAGRLTWRTVSS